MTEIVAGPDEPADSRTIGPDAPAPDGSLGCAGCGDCCERINLTIAAADNTAIVSTSGGLSTVRPQPHGKRTFAIAGRYMRDAAFINQHMRPTGDVSVQRWTDDDGVLHQETRQIRSCDQFDPESRRCLAHDQRPMMCSAYPFYGRPDGRPNSDELRCSYWLDVAPERRPEGARPLIPLTVVR